MTWRPPLLKCSLSARGIAVSEKNGEDSKKPYARWYNSTSFTEATSLPERAFPLNQDLLTSAIGSGVGEQEHRAGEYLRYIGGPRH